MLERLIAHHCGPALAGIKPANIAACHKKLIPNIHSEIQKLSHELSVKGIYIDIICECEKRVLVMVYRKKVLENHLKNPEMTKFLSGYGYPEAADVGVYIGFLRQRLKDGDFPHEIGVFLGYPLHDIHGFINHRDEGCLLVGEWKVYKEAEKAQKLFARYKACRRAIVKRLSSGMTLAQIFSAA